ncbi:phage antirepressor N-terminal domain-containing protein (plasmid) [Azospirillum sp. HJ39]|uniref:phage antirepressor N-terminal domain-containing protein n=1 Tax=Azospirillum sp. HJ39 TaxID=3159496 RepID=UPI003558B0B1
MTAMLEIVPFPPTGDTLWACRNDDGRVVVSVRPICEALGLTWGSQFNRIKRTPSLSTTIFMMKTVAADGKVREVLCLPLDLIPGWLFGVDVNRVKPELRDRLIAYQRECHRVLFDHFAGTVRNAIDMAAVEEVSMVDPVDAAIDLPGPDRTLGLWLGIIREARLIEGRDAARRLWRQSPLPPLDGTAGILGPEWVEAFLAACTDHVPGVRLASDELWRSYLAWCGRNGIDPITRVSFGRALTPRLRSTKASRIYYLDVRLKR